MCTCSETATAVCNRGGRLPGMNLLGKLASGETPGPKRARSAQLAPPPVPSIASVVNGQEAILQH